MDEQVLAEVRRLTAAEDDPIVAARERAGDLVHVPSPELGALLRWAATVCTARAVVEVGSTGGVSGLWLLRGLAERAVLTSIEPDPHTHGLATQAFEQVGAGTRVRSILGDPETVLERLSDAAYDLVVLQAQPGTYPSALEHTRRLLRPGGMLVARGILRHGEHADPLARFVQALVDDEGFDAVVLPLDEGLALATRVADPAEAEAAVAGS